ncbi:MAG: tetratricopeptide repeat protein [Candidatus Sumerlaeia bacterium]
MLWICLGINSLPAQNQKQPPPKKELTRQEMREVGQLLRAKKYEEAVEQLQTLSKEIPDNGWVLLSLAEARRGQGQVEESDQLALKAFKLNPDKREAETLYKFARGHSRNRKHEKALALLEPLNRNNGDNPRYASLLVSTYNQLGQHEKSTLIGNAFLDRYLNAKTKEERDALQINRLATPLAEAYSEKEQLENQIRRIERELARDMRPDVQENLLLPFLMYISEKMSNNNKNALAALYLKKAAAIQDDDPWLHRKVARSLRLANRKKGLDDAIDYLEKLEKDGTEDVGVLEDLAYYLFEAEKYARAEKIYRKLFAAHPDTVHYEDRIIESLSRQQRYDEAGEILLERIRKIERSDQPSDNIGREIHRLERKHRTILAHTDIREERMKDMRIRISTDVDNANLYYQLGEMLLDQGEYELALSEHLRGAYVEEDGRVLINKARELQRSRQAAAAMKYIIAVFEHFPANEDAIDLINSIETMHRARWAVFFDPKMAKGDELIVWACRQMIASDAPQKIKFRAWLNLIEKKYEHQPHSVEIGKQARAEYEKLLQDHEWDDNQKNHIEREIEKLEKHWINAQ